VLAAWGQSNQKESNQEESNQEERATRRNMVGNDREHGRSQISMCMNLAL
jgi:hypothetical protein